MKKAITILMAAALVFGFAGMASAQDCTTCLDPLDINRGCETIQDACYPFDYENQVFFPDENRNTITPYCEGPEGKADPRVVFPVCDCPFADELIQGAVVDVRLEILVNGETGANGAYWAENVNDNSFEFAEGGGIPMEAYASETLACEDDTPFQSAFVGEFRYRGYDEDGELTGMTPLVGNFNCDPDEEDRPTIIEPVLQQGTDNHGYTITLADAENDRSQFAIDIPHIKFDPSMIDEGDVISVQICLTCAEDGEVNVGSICGGCGCCCEFELGTILCCREGTSSSLTYPYVTAMNDANWWYGMVITNLSSFAGEAEVTIYETDGDTETVTVDVDANSMFVASNVDLMDAFGEGIGDARAYFKVKTDFSADGFLFIGNDGKSEAMGYLPRQ